MIRSIEKSSDIIRIQIEESIKNEKGIEIISEDRGEKLRNTSL
jgi:hypothetical protein